MASRRDLIDMLQQAESNFEVVKDKYKDIPINKRIRNVEYSRAFNLVNKIKNSIEKFDLKQNQNETGLSDALKILKSEFGIHASKAMTTAVRGYHNHSFGYKTHNNTIELIGHFPFDEIVNRLSQNFNISVSRPVSTLRDTRSSITILGKK
jgi:hypothetical protein